MNKELGKPQSDADVINKQPKVLLIGYGWVGQYMGKFFTEADYVENDLLVKRVCDSMASRQFDDYDMAIISVPTPMNKETGQCDVSIVDEVVEQYKDQVSIFLVKSTVEIGTCERLSQKHNTTVCMSPEYIGETLGHPLVKPDLTQFQIIGGPKKEASIVAEYFMRVLHADAQLLLVTAIEAEIIKYFENYWIAQRVSFWNDVYQATSLLEASFQAVRNGLTLDPRLSRTHSNVYKNNRGWSGKCLSKDLPALAYKMRKLNSPVLMLEHLIKENAKVRKDYNDNNQLMPNRPLWKTDEEN